MQRKACLTLAGKHPGRSACQGSRKGPRYPDLQRLAAVRELPLVAPYA